MGLDGVVMRSVRNTVEHVLATGSVFEVDQSVVVGVIVKVANLKTIWAGADEGFHDQFVDPI